MTRKIFIFDLDGMIVDTQTPFHAMCECAVLKLHHEIEISPEDISARFAGISTRQVFKELAPYCDPNFLVKEKWEKMYLLAESRRIECLPGMFELIRDLHQLGHGLAIASASPKRWIELCLEKAHPDEKLMDIFKDKYFSAEDCERSKPHPDVFLKARTGFGNVEITEDMEKDTFVIGDGRADVLGGLAAKFPVLYLSSTNTEFDENMWVNRFNFSEELAQHVRNNL